MAGIKSIGGSQERWENRSFNAAQDYVEGAKNPKRPWAQSAIAAEANYKSQVIAAANAGRYGKMVAKAGDAAWNNGIDRKGLANYQTGVTGQGSAWATGFSPYQAAYQSFQLGPRGPSNSPANYQRSQASGQLFAQVKTRIKG